MRIQIVSQLFRPRQKKEEGRGGGGGGEERAEALPLDPETVVAKKRFGRQVN